MSSYTISQRKRQPRFIDTAARYGVRNVLRPFIRRARDLAFVAVLHVPEGTCEYYKRAADALIADPMPVDEECNELAVVIVLHDIAVEPRSLFKRFRYARQIVILTERLEHIPPEMRASADIVAVIAPPTAEHYEAAAREIGMSGMTPDIAALMTGFSLDVLSATNMETRPLATVVRYLRRSAAEREKVVPAPPKPKGPGLEDMAGYGAAKTWGLQLADDLRAWKAGEIAWDDVDRGALLYGPPGTGKTRYAAALANSCGVSLVVASAARWQAAGHLGDYLKSMRAAFALASKQAPSILFVDEFDSFGDRESAGDDDHRDYRRQVVNAMLECLDPADGREGVIVVGATNNPSAIDRALLRSGRLETLVEIPLPDAEARVAILRYHLKAVLVTGDLTRFASATAGWSGADIEKLARDARRLSRRRKSALTAELLLEAMPESYVLSDGELRHSAVHEAGHAIVGAVLGNDDLEYVRIERQVRPGIPVQSAGSAAFQRRRGRIRTVEYYDDHIAMLLGGIAAERVVYGNYGDGAGGSKGSDLVVASDVATRLERHYGFGEALSTELGRGDLPLEDLRGRDPVLRRLVDARLKAQFDRACALLVERRVELDLLSARLLARGHVEGEEVRALCGVLSGTSPT
ncbi:ATP-dependent Zn protease [Rhizobium sp. PP-CC-2G-626]|nr:ATP-dependent Zn protease [Rhizobium sp. PP-CC-2G-626]